MKVISLDEPRSRQPARGGSKRTSSRAIMREIQIQKLACNGVGRRDSGNDITGCKNIVTLCEELRLFRDGPIRVGLILEYCPNGSLYGYITSRGLVLREWEARRVLVQLCGGVAWLHKRQIVHGDLKLSNLLLDSRCDLKICDFGHSFVVENEEFGVSNESCLDIAGTPNYLAPEVVECLLGRNAGAKQHEAPRRISYEIDIWAIGVCLYAMLIGTPPFQIDFNRTTTTTTMTTLEDLYRRIRQVEYAYPPSDSISVSDSVKRLIKNILVSEPYGRLSLLEIVADKWLRESYFPDKLSLSADNIHLDSNFDNRKSILNFKRCLIKSGFRQLIVGISSRPFGKKSKRLANREHVKLRGTATLDTEAVSKISLLRQQIDKTLEERSKEAKSRRLERLQRWLPLRVRYTNPVRDNKVASQILISHRRLTLTTLIEYELIVEFRVQSGPQYTITTSTASSSSSFSSNETPHGGTFVVASRVSTDDDGSFSYKLSDGSIGLLSSDTAHTILVNRQAKRMWYIIPDNDTGWLGKCFDLDQENLFPEELSNRLATAEMLANSLDSSFSDYSFNIQTNGFPEEDIFVRRFTIFEDKFDTKSFELSDGSFQFEFLDRESLASTTILLQNNGKLVTTILSTTGVCEQWSLWEFLHQCGLDPRMMDMFQHMKRCLTEQ